MSPDLRNSRTIDVIRRLEALGHRVSVADPLADAGEAQREHGFTLTAVGAARYDLVLGAVGHKEYRDMDAGHLAALLTDGGTLADLKGIWRGVDLPGVDRWSL